MLLLFLLFLLVCCFLLLLPRLPRHLLKTWNLHLLIASLLCLLTCGSRLMYLLKGPSASLLTLLLHLLLLTDLLFRRLT